VYRITEAPGRHSDDLDQRINRYLISMAIRTACVILVFFVSGPLRWVFVAGAVGLPYVAVLFANAGGRRRRPVTSTPVHARGLTAPAPVEAEPGAGAPPEPGTGTEDRWGSR